MPEYDLSEAVGVLVKHQARYDSTGWSCTCGHRYGQPQNVALATEAHRLGMTVAATREQVAQELLSGLPAALITTARDEDGWASDMQDAQLRLVNDGWVAFCGEGAVDIRHIAEHAALIARGES